MTIDQLRKTAKAEPFLPFTICLADGRRFCIRHPECILIPLEASRTFVVAESGEDYSIIDVLLVTSIDFGNGRGGRKKKRRGKDRK